MDDNLGGLETRADVNFGILWIFLDKDFGNFLTSLDAEIPTWKNWISNIVNKKISDVDAGFSSETPVFRTLMKRCLITVTSFILLFSFDLIIRILSMITSRLKDGFHKWIGWKWISGSWVDWMKPKELLRWFQNFPITFVDHISRLFFIHNCRNT
ncbi:hypothetical protein RhiirA1_477300 [Rhizophagus irregularis]|uniref:Uncharacterized protein n=1 Tax=Rhizophagus irregularis TaxID=588596 RepID=A0A2N0QTP2_9GLOM|nr:hypothetical protein RhiirA1_477300 [Rhizophagus irregularis]